MIDFSPCPKGYSLDQDKAVTPEETLARVKARLGGLPVSIVARTRRIDNGRLGIPVFLSECGEDARRVMPTRKQMGKGASAAQAEASALMELMERYGFFSFWERLPGADYATWATWDEAEERFGERLMPLEQVIAACHDSVKLDAARAVMNLRRWVFVPATRIPSSLAACEAENAHEFFVPLDLFKALGEFNGSSAGNTDVESVLQGACELVERHVCCLADRHMTELPTISTAPAATGDPVVEELLSAFRRAGITVILKDFTQGLPVPTVAAFAYDASTFPERSELVFTAGTASSPAKAAARALTEVAQLAGDFNSCACYEASGLPKYAALTEAEWLRAGPVVSLSSLPDISSPDIRDELFALASGLQALGFPLYSVATTSPETGVPTHYSIAPGLLFRERDVNASLGLFAGRLIVEEWKEGDVLPDTALDALAALFPGAHYLPFFKGMLALREGRGETARAFFGEAEGVQPDDEAKALCAFYAAYAATLESDWEGALPQLIRAADLAPDMKEYKNLLGVCFFKLGRYEEAAHAFSDIVTRLDKGSAVDLQNLGLCRKFLGQFDEAKRYLAAALAIDPALEAAATHLRELYGETETP